jgi:hypothetical protein
VIRSSKRKADVKRKKARKPAIEVEM